MKKGFTLIELLVVVLIIGILSAIALPQYEKAVLKSKLAIMKPLVESVAQAEEIYYLENGEYTSNWNDLSIDAGKEHDITSDEIYLLHADDIPGLKESLQNEALKVRDFDWGDCVIGLNQQVECSYRPGETPILMYKRKFQHSTGNYAGRASCEGRSKSANQLCLAETGDTQSSSCNMGNGNAVCYYP